MVIIIDRLIRGLNSTSAHLTMCFFLLYYYIRCSGIIIYTDIKQRVYVYYLKNNKIYTLKQVRGSFDMSGIPVEKNKDYEIDIDNLGYEGEGVGQFNNFKIFVPGALIGERVEIKIVKVSKNFAFGKLIRVIKASADRIEPLCSLKRCGGCQLLHLAYDAQLRYKKHRVQECIERIGRLDPSLVHDTIGMKNPYRYRNKAQFPVGMKNGNIVIGFFAPRSHEVIDTPSCLIQDDMSNQVIKVVKDWAQHNSISVYDERDRTGILRHVMVRKAFKTGEMMVVIVTNGCEMPFKDELIERLRTKIPAVKSIIQNINREATNVVLGRDNKTLFGSDRIVDYIGNLKFQISPLSFFQVNPYQTEALYNKVIEYADLSGNETVIDAYCGTGAISLFVAQKVKKVYGVEVVEAAIADAKKNAAENGICNAQFIAGKSETVIPELYKQGMKADVIIVDPPRKGCELGLLTTIASMKPEKLIYVSCDPGTLARDLRYLSQNGFEVRDIQPFDMFAQTAHVETVVLMSRGDK